MFFATVALGDLSYVLSPVVIGVVHSAVLPVAVSEGVGSIYPPFVQ